MRPILLAALIAVPVVTLSGCDRASARSSDAGDDTASPAVAASVAPSAPGAQSRAARVEAGYTMGEEDAPIAVVEFSDFGCPYCARFARATLPVLTREYIAAGTARWRYVPVTFGFPGGELMGSAAVCTAELAGDDAFWEAHDLLYTRQTALRAEGARPRLLDWMAELGLDRAELDACIDAPGTAATLEANTRTAVEWYARGTPTFIVNGVPMSGAMPVDFFRKVFATVLDPSGL